MRPYACLIGSPVEHSKSPTIHRFWLDALGIDGDYRADRVEPHQLQAYLDERRQESFWRGCNVTAPLKELALQFVDDLSDRAKRIGALNVIHCREGHLYGDNFDVDGVAAALRSCDLAGQAAVVLGAGGAARAAIHHLQECGAREIRVITRNPSRAAGLNTMDIGGSQISVSGFDTLTLDDAAVLINASPMGMEHVPMPREILRLVKTMRPDSMVFDMVYHPLKTSLLEAARCAGLSVSDGLTMLVGQAEPSFQQFFGSFTLPRFIQAVPQGGSSPISE